MAKYLSPGVYVEEVALLPPSVAEVATAIPAFIGYTENFDGTEPIVAEIGTLREFEDRFGKAPPIPYSVKADAQGNLQLFLPNPAAASPPPPGGGAPAPAADLPAPGSIRPTWLLWYSLDFYFRNGGSRCYVVAVGKASDATIISKEAFSKGLLELEKQDEPTLLVTPEASLLQTSDFKDVCGAALNHCARLQDRFAILDVKERPNGASIAANADLLSARQNYAVDRLDYGAVYYPFLQTTLPALVDEKTVSVDSSMLKSPPAGSPLVKLNTIATSDTDLYNRIKKLLADQRVTLPPGPAMAGVYVRVDRERGVWKAPANVPLQAVISPVDLLTDKQQGDFNIDASTGKSINVIRSFTGRGTVVWGARTLAGNDNEWRYVPVRRLFITIEESVKKATNFAVFEPNDASTWLKVKGMIESYLYTLWEQGALQGSKPESAYFVNVGLGRTMTAQDILNGLLKVEIGIAAVRPAEFIILRFSHRLAQA